jgi:hypothetical protein
MKKMILVYVLQLAMLATFLFVGLRVLEELRATRAELVGIREEQLKQPSLRMGRGGAIPVEVTNSSLSVTVSR